MKPGCTIYPANVTDESNLKGIIILHFGQLGLTKYVPTQYCFVHFELRLLGKQYISGIQ